MRQSDFSTSPTPVEPTFDSFDDSAADETVAQPHNHVPISTAYAKGTGRRIRFAAAILAVALAAAFVFVQQIKLRKDTALASETAARAEEAPPVEVIRVDMAPPTQTLTLPGETRGWYNSTIYARVSGYVAKWIADIGDRVKKDQVLATIDTPELDAQLEAAQAQLKASEAEVKVREADVEFAKTTYDRWQGSPKGVVSEQEREDKKARYAMAIAQLNAARARVALDQANVDRLSFQTSFKQVTAPYEGVITDRRVDIGDLVTAGSGTNITPLYGIAQSEQIRVFVNVPQAASAEIGDGTPAQVTAGEYANRTFEGKVTRTSKSIDRRARTLRVEVDLANDDRALVPGMYVQVAFHLKPTSFVQVPASALLFRAAGPQVAVIDDNGTVKFQDVTIARDNGNFVELASGLSPGQRVALNISNQIAEGDRVTVREEAKTAQAR
ncbi:MAG TPA: efflux RND transporter periplasmic adaptor subunit [Xanthobacteraceae bacterium]|nr:efflux RND transporter periplasmic adaptor subunit [Xanthobacteraceae bacterium]